MGNTLQNMAPSLSPIQKEMFRLKNTKLLHEDHVCELENLERDEEFSKLDYDYKMLLIKGLEN